MRLGLVGCVSEKASRRAPAAELYTSALFLGRRAWVERTCDRWFILSALHGLVSPETELEPYDLSLAELSAGQRRDWAQRVLRSLDAETGGLGGAVVEIHAGAHYRDFGITSGLLGRGAEVEVPMAHLSIGRQLAAYAGREGHGGLHPVVGREQVNRSATDRRVSPRPGAYAPLRSYLESVEDRTSVTLTFAAVERVLGRDLPASARRHRPWWANHAGSHTHARSWLDAGWRVSAVDLNAAVVAFERGSSR